MDAKSGSLPGGPSGKELGVPFGGPHITQRCVESTKALYDVASNEGQSRVRKVIASYFTYSWLYEKQPVPALPLAARGKAHEGPKKKTDDAGGGDDAKPSHAGRTAASRR